MSLWNEVDDARGKALSNTAMGGIYSFIGEKQKALDAHENALRLLNAIDDQQREAAALNGIGKVYEDLNDFPKAFETYSRALQIYQEIRNQEFTALTQYYLDRVCRMQGNKKQAAVDADAAICTFDGERLREMQAGDPAGSRCLFDEGRRLLHAM